MQKEEISVIQKENGDYILICVNTGEQVGSLSASSIPDGDRIKRIEIIKKEQREYSDTKNDIRWGELQTFKPYSNFIKENMVALLYIQENGKMSKTDWEIYNLLKSNIAIVSNFVKFSSNKYMSISDICNRTGLNSSTIYKSIKKLKLLEIIVEIAEQGKHKIIFNPYVAYKGNTVRKKTLNLFKNTIYKEY